jgi:predicted transcriptional regulator
MFQLPPEIQQKIYEFDGTHHKDYQKVVKEVRLMSKMDDYFKSRWPFILYDKAHRNNFKKVFSKRVLEIICKNKRIKTRKRDNKDELLLKISELYSLDKPYLHVACVQFAASGL